MVLINVPGAKQIGANNVHNFNTGQLFSMWACFFHAQMLITNVGVNIIYKRNSLISQVTANTIFQPLPS